MHITGPVAFADAVEQTLFLRGAFVVRPELPSQETLAGFTAAGALIVTHTVSDGQTVAFGDRRAAVTSVDDLLRFLEAHAILTGVPKR